ncbi:hypothetical protein SAMN06296008_1094 [Polynucleobacter kasalickyi]|uniref:Uncharacterized protein n=1 Tax=Polynucleobacter kasalickyi TaxID=1938817 RepID=A0A1W2AJH7_9BURK|nr:hypothetical protein SAMN06296008_1094 [Polynucleobacter kasalickyi]
MYVNLNTSQSELSLNFVNFSEDLVLREVILGMNCQTSMVNILKLINSDSKVRVLKAGMAKRSFKIIEDRSFRHATNL